MAPIPSFQFHNVFDTGRVFPGQTPGERGEWVRNPYRPQHRSPFPAFKLHGIPRAQSQLSADSSRNGDLPLGRYCTFPSHPLPAPLNVKAIRSPKHLNPSASNTLARTFHLPLYVVRFDSVIGSYLGQTAVHLRELFEYARKAESVLLFDEIDALGKRRGHPSDVGELDRIVIALMQELEFSESKGLLIATSNLPQSLDIALWRRFDLAIEFPKPTRAALTRFAREKQETYGLSLRPKLLQQAAALPSFADAARFIEDDARRRTLAQNEALMPQDFEPRAYERTT